MDELKNVSSVVCLRKTVNVCMTAGRILIQVKSEGLFTGCCTHKRHSSIQLKQGYPRGRCWGYRLCHENLSSMKQSKLGHARSVISNTSFKNWRVRKVKKPEKCLRKLCIWQMERNDENRTREHRGEVPWRKNVDYGMENKESYECLRE